MPFDPNAYSKSYGSLGPQQTGAKVAALVVLAGSAIITAALSLWHLANFSR